MRSGVNAGVLTMNKNDFLPPALTLAGDQFTEEEWLTYQLIGDGEHDAFARALLAHRATVGDALQGRSWMY